MILPCISFRNPRLFDMMGVVVVKLTYPIAILVLPLFIGCERGESPESTAPDRPAPKSATADITEDIVATVNGNPIYAGEISNLIASAPDDLSPEKALEILVQNKLLAEEARRRGFAAAPEIEIIQKDALARELLISRVGEGITAQSIPRKHLQRCYDARKMKYDHPTLRRVVHFLAKTKGTKLSEEDARAIAEKARQAAAHATDANDFVLRVKPLTDEGGKEVFTESLSPFARDDKQLVQPFVDATFALSKVGDISPPTQTIFGFHVIFLAEEIPAEHRTLDDVKEEVAEACLPQVRRETAAEIISSLLDRNETFIYEDALKSGRFPL